MTDAVKQAKIKRRNSKAALTRQGKTLSIQVSGNRPAEETKRELEKYEQKFSELLSKHEKFIMLLEEDTEFEQEELWMEDCQETYLKLKIDTEDYLREIAISKEQKESNGSKKPPDEAEKTDVNTVVTEKTAAGTSVESSEKTTEALVIQDESLTGNADNQVKNIPTSPPSSLQENVTGIQNPAENVPNADNVVIPPGNNENTEHVPPPVTANGNVTQSAFRMEKPKMPRFSGDVREFAIFKADFKHLVESRYSKWDAITILRSNLSGKPLELIKGIGQDYDAAWEYLESIYGDPRFVADTITQVRPLRDEEDARFCDLVHLVRRSFNSLTEVGRQNDMDNNHMLAIIEQKMCPDDRKVWSRFLESTKAHATLQVLMSWMTSEMKSRMRATAPLRNFSQVNQVSEIVEKKPVNHKCW